jgi:hypothetical protein
MSEQLSLRTWMFGMRRCGACLCRDCRYNKAKRRTTTGRYVILVLLRVLWVTIHHVGACIRNDEQTITPFLYVVECVNTAFVCFCCKSLVI